MVPDSHPEILACAVTVDKIHICVPTAPELPVAEKKYLCDAVASETVKNLHPCETGGWIGEEGGDREEVKDVVVDNEKAYGMSVLTFSFFTFHGILAPKMDLPRNANE